MVYFGLTDKGKVRSNNQDNFAVYRLQDGLVLAVVCDGMGGAAGGAQASKTACEAFCGFVKENVNLLTDAHGALRTRTAKSVLLSAVSKANAAVYKKALLDASLSGMGTTLVACLAHRDGLLAVNVGDSRIYALYGDKIKRVSKDHSLVQTMVDNGQITEEQAFTHPQRNIILRSVGIDDTVEPDFFALKADMDSVLLCSDGLSGYFRDQELPGYMQDGSPEDRVRRMVKTANALGGGDNITAVIIDIKGTEDGI